MEFKISCVEMFSLISVCKCSPAFAVMSPLLLSYLLVFGTFVSIFVTDLLRETDFLKRDLFYAYVPFSLKMWLYC